MPGPLLHPIVDWIEALRSASITETPRGVAEKYAAHTSWLVAFEPAWQCEPQPWESQPQFARRGDKDRPEANIRWMTEPMAPGVRLAGQFDPGGGIGEKAVESPPMISPVDHSPE
jgi:hypothetical protein